MGTGFSGPASVILALAIVCSLVTVDRVVLARTQEKPEKQPGIETIQCDDTGHYLTRLYRRGEIVYEKPNPGLVATAGGASGNGQAAQQGCQPSGGRAPSRGVSNRETSNRKTSGTM